MNGEPVDVAAIVDAAVEPLPSDDALAEPPNDLTLSPEAQKAWRRLAPYALKERTLAPSRTPGFAKLCQEWAYCAEFEARIQHLGITAAESDRLLKRLNDHKKLLKASLGDFNLKSFGKPAVPEKKPAETGNAFAAAFGGAPR